VALNITFEDSKCGFVVHGKENVQGSRHCCVCRILVFKLMLLWLRLLLSVETNSYLDSLWKILNGGWVMHQSAGWLSLSGFPLLLWVTV